ncbi:MAG TPA: hypothetical protein VGF55_07860, partial [Gemmataceae bacterium]
MSDDPRLADAQRRLLRPASIDDVRGTLPVLADLTASPELMKSAEEGLRRAFEILRELTTPDPDQAVKVLIADLLPLCLVPDRADDRGFGHRLSYVFGPWLADLPEEHRHQVRAAVLPQALAALGGDSVRNAIRLISSIGYWDNEILAALDGIVRVKEDETGDHALSALVALRPGLDPHLRERYLKKLHNRIPAGPNLHQIICGRDIGTPATADLVWTHWLAPQGPHGSERNLLAHLALSVLAEIAARERDPAFTSRVWNWLVELSRRSDIDTESVFSPNSSLVNLLDVAAAVPELVRLATRSEGNRRYIYYLRALECARPAHMAGWDGVTDPQLKVVRHDAVTPTGIDGRFATAGLYRKEAAWDILLCRGEPLALPSFGAAVAEEHGYVAHRLLGLAACLGLAPLPRVVWDLLAASAPGMARDDHEGLAAQIGAINAAHGSATEEAFDALLGYRQIGDGVLLSLVDALGETARIILASGNRSPAERLLMAAEMSPRDDSRAAAAGAVAALVEAGNLSASEVMRAAELLRRPATDLFSKRELLFAFANSPAASVPAAAVEYASGVLVAQAESKPDLEAAAVTLVARLPESRSDAAFLARHLGLTELDGVPVATSPRFASAVPHVVGRWFYSEPERFGPAVASLLGKGDAMAVAQVLPWVRRVGASSPTVVVDGLVTRLRDADGGQVAEPTVLQTLAAVAPNRLLTDGCRNMASWLPQARADLADTLGRLGPLHEGQASARFDLLTELAGDGIYAVRRAAYRAAATSDVERLISLAIGWAGWRQPGRQGPRRYAAECAGWLSSPIEAEHFAQLASDQEPAVREAYERSHRERADRMAAADYEDRVLSVRDSQDVIRNWRHGVALSRVGDDSTLRRL